MEYVVKTNRKEEIYILKKSNFYELLLKCKQEFHIDINNIDFGGCANGWWYVFLDKQLEFFESQKKSKSWCVTNYKDTKILYIELQGEEI